jgi:hypothetical protein
MKQEVQTGGFEAVKKRLNKRYHKLLRNGGLNVEIDQTITN